MERQEEDQLRAAVPWSRRGSLATAAGRFRDFFFEGCRCALFAFHVFVFDRVEDLTAGLALDEFSILVAGNDADNGMFAGGSHVRLAGLLASGALDFVAPAVPCQSIN